MTYYDYVVRYQIEAKCCSPFRTGSAYGDREEILLDEQGTPFFQGTSLAGALRNWLTETETEKKAEKLFGSEEQEGKLIISDGVFTGKPDLASRPRIRMDGRTGSAEEGKKFDVKYIAAESIFTFSITCLGKKEEADWNDVENMLAALDSGQIRLGALKSGGFGRVRLSVKKQHFDLKKEADRIMWLEDQENYSPVHLRNVKERRKVTFVLSGTMQEVLVKDSGQETRKLSEEISKSVTKNITENGLPVIPGSSVRGAIRTRVELIARELNIDPDVIKEMFGCAADGAESGICGNVQFEDVCLNKRPGREQKREVRRIRINKFTGGVIRGALFTEEPVNAKVQIRIRMNEKPEACVLMLYALRDLGIHLYGLGSGYAIGRGYIDAEILKVTLPDGQMMKMMFGENHTVTMNEEGKNILRAWAAQMGEAGK